jgi:hypothetical protein
LIGITLVPYTCSPPGCGFGGELCDKITHEETPCGEFWKTNYDLVFVPKPLSTFQILPPATLNVNQTPELFAHSSFHQVNLGKFLQRQFFVKVQVEQTTPKIDANQQIRFALQIEQYFIKSCVKLLTRD